ncbi:helix-turn-helix domain-containing protein [Arthrobacter sp. KBS0703]|nr:helix-turn-helix domain-containing protein [Arthrobacter sp. KBS0703]
MQPQQLISLAESSARTGLSEKTLRRRIADGLLPAYRVGPRAIRVKPEDLDKLLRPMPASVEGRRQDQLADYIARTVEAFPPLTREQLDRIAVLLHSDPEAGK